MANLPRNKITSPLRNGWKTVWAIQETHRCYIRSELSQVRGLIPILMKHRNGEQWSAEERAILLRDLRTLSNLSPYLIIIMPGGVLMLPILAWWLDHRRKARENKP